MDQYEKNQGLLGIHFIIVGEKEDVVSTRDLNSTGQIRNLLFASY